MITTHALILFLSTACFFLALLTGLFFLVQEGRIKRKDPRALRGRTISLEALDRINWLAVVAGFGLFSFGMLQGHWLANRHWGGFWSGDPIEILSLATWLAYAAVLVLRLRAGLRGRRVVMLSVMSFLLVMLTYGGVHQFLQTRHGGF